MRGFDSYRLLTLSLAALMTRISSVVIEGAHTSAGAATLARTVPFWGRFRSPREPTAGPCRGCLLPSATNTAPSRHHLQAVLCDGWDVQTPPSWLLRPQTRPRRASAVYGEVVLSSRPKNQKSKVVKCPHTPPVTRQSCRPRIGVFATSLVFEQRNIVVCACTADSVWTLIENM